MRLCGRDGRRFSLIMPRDCSLSCWSDLEKPSSEICHDNVSKPWAYSSRGRVIFASPCCRKGQVQLQFIAPRSPRRGGGEEGPGELRCKFCAQDLSLEKKARNRAKWDPRGFLSCELLISAHVLTTVYPTSYHGSGIPSLSSSSSVTR